MMHKIPSQNINPFHTAGEKSPDGMERVIAPADAREVAENSTLPLVHV